MNENASPPVKAATKPLASMRSPIWKQTSASARVANCAQVSLIHPCRRDHRTTSPPARPIAAPATRESTSVAKMKRIQCPSAGSVRRDASPSAISRIANANPS